MDGKTALQVISEFKKTRELYEPGWYRNHFAYENNCFIGYNRVTGRLIRTPYRKKFFNNFPEIKKQCDSFENLLLLFMPLFVFYPTDIGDNEKKQMAKYLSRAMKQKYIDWDSQDLIHKFIHTALKYPVAFWEFNIENRPVNGQIKKVINCSIGNPFDWYFDIRKPFEENMLVARVLRKTKKEIEEYKDFKLPKEGSGASNSEDMQEMIYSDKYGARPEAGDLKTYICYQTFEKTAKGITMLIIDQGGNELDKKEYQNAQYYPVIPLKLSSGDYYQPSFVANLIPLARAITLTANRLEDFYLKFTKGQYLARKGNDISFSDENNTVVNYTTELPTIVPTPTLPTGAIDWYRDLFSASERYGVNLVALAGMPTKSNMRSAAQMETSVKTQQMQQKTSLDNMMQAFKRIAEVYMYYWSEITDTIDNIVFKSNEVGQTAGSEFEKKGFIGEKYAPKDPAAIPIPRIIQNLEVQIEDVSTATMQEKFNKTLEVAKALTQIDPGFRDILLDMLDIGTTSDIIDELDKKKTLLNNPEFMALIEQARAGQLPSEEAQALMTMLRFLSQSAPTPTPEQMGVQSKGMVNQEGGLSPEDISKIEGEDNTVPQKSETKKSKGKE